MIIKIKDFEEYGFTITWTLLYFGYRSESIFNDYLNATDIISYAINKLYDEKCNDKWVYELAGENELNTENISNLLLKLSNSEKINKEIELKKWTVIIVAKELSLKSNDYIDGLIHLGDIWIKLGFPKDSPHIFQGKNNKISPKEYYTKENYEYLYQKHLLWLKKEILYIKNNQT